MEVRGRRCCGAIAALLIFAIGSGCSGTRHRGPSIAEPGTNGALTSVRIQPTPGATFISRATTFRLSWTAENPPPSVFSVALRRYKEERGEEPRSTDTQVTDLTREGDTFNWTLKRRDDFDLDKGGVYYLELSGGGESVFASYLVSDDRSQKEAMPGATELSASVPAGAERASVHEVHLP